MGLFVKTILNKPVSSNCHILFQNINKNCIIIDPGTEDCIDLFDFIENRNLIPEFIFLTHEHFDHILGVKKLKETYNCKIVCSADCSEKIISKKKNMSVFYNQIGFEAYPADIFIENIGYQLDWNGKTIEFISTKGHTDSSICILVDDNLFTGDTIIKNQRTVIKLPGGSKLKLIESTTVLDKKFTGKRIRVYSGHGESFWFNKQHLKEFI